ncbi:CinA family nicotinamide mononucleotide deamidase-related protein [Desulforhopalus sp. IMCC35007]|uniref:CinA family nicotinamide mononucleotide deamidase-related protein n=1 Tax=Desulforhopalus sp. IMCC35007 TaxID=2569543 RepID=UPI0010AE8FE9|nr:CinA family nicotinamide mononucleotide deamidase-related protein [Desulforhopalus sp. IMCC35007]TKB07936.1 CinA family nicotinamide mononucleotide deamidase-related protein [Desulforhopalus sp. IMCC35007]
MKVEIIAIGDELTSGRILNTTSSFAARHLYEAGYDIYAMNTIGDSPILIGEALKQALSRADAVLVTGGLGTTDDDLTNEAVSKALNRPTMPNLEILANIRTHLDEITANPVSPLEKLAWLPSGAEALNPQSRMAGYQLIHDNKPIFFLPGVPSQMRHLLIEDVLPKLSTWHEDHRLTTYHRIFRIFNLPESEVNRHITSLDLSPDVHIGYYPVFPEVHLSLTVRDKKDNNAKRLFKSSCKAITTVLGDSIYGINRDSMEKVVGNLLIGQSLTLSIAESCTGGLICSKITDTPGSSEYLLGGVVSYSNFLKSEYLGVSNDLLNKHGAVSREVAEAMAVGVRVRSKSDIGLSVTGIAGPSGGSDEKPVGTVYIAIATTEENWVTKFLFAGNRKQIREITAQSSLDLIRKYLLSR